MTRVTHNVQTCDPLSSVTGIFGQIMLENLIQSSYSFQTNLILFFGGKGDINFCNIKYIMGCKKCTHHTWSSAPKSCKRLCSMQS